MSCRQHGQRAPLLSIIAVSGQPHNPVRTREKVQLLALPLGTHVLRRAIVRRLIKPLGKRRRGDTQAQC